MPDSSGDENDSRTASVGLQRPRSNGSSDRPSSQDRGIARRHKRQGARLDRRDVRDFVPQGGTFSSTALDVDPDSTSSSGSDSSREEDDSASDDAKASEAQQPLGAVPPAINWNRGSRSAIRTTLSARVSKPAQNTATSGFDEVNGKYWRSRSASVSASDDEEDAGVLLREMSEKSDSEEGQVTDVSPVPNGQDRYLDDSDDSDSGEVSEGGDSIMLNVGSRNGHTVLDETNDATPSEVLFQSDPHPAPVNGANEQIVSDLQAAGESSLKQSKEDAFRSFSRKYATPPSILADLDSKDLEVQARHFFYNRSIHDIDLTLPIACTECLQEGHLAEVCPSKECEHCGAWDQHQSSFCPSWRRCQKCRERGHDERQCPSALKGSASEVPCDFCGSENHLELDCDVMWKFPKRNPSPGPILVSVSCCYCTSNRHLVGDCPSLPRPMSSSSWTLKPYDPSMITNINDVVRGRQQGRPSNGRQGCGLRIRGRAEQHSPSPESDDDMLAKPGRRNPVNRNQGRPNIRFGSGIGRNRDLAGPQDSRGRPGGGSDVRETYRDRQDFFVGNNTRQRSLSPNPHPVRGRGVRHSWQPRSPPNSRSRPPPPRRGRGGGNGEGNGRGGGRGGKNKRGGNGDAYRPMPSAGKKAWDKFRL